VLVVQDVNILDVVYCIFVLTEIVRSGRPDASGVADCFALILNSYCSTFIGTDVNSEYGIAYKTVWDTKVW